MHLDFNRLFRMVLQFRVGIRHPMEGPRKRNVSSVFNTIHPKIGVFQIRTKDPQVDRALLLEMHRAIGALRPKAERDLPPRIWQPISRCKILARFQLPLDFSDTGGSRAVSRWKLGGQLGTMARGAITGCCAAAPIKSSRRPDLRPSGIAGALCTSEFLRGGHFRIQTGSILGAFRDTHQ
jgi:hypothetical protein